MAIFKQFYFSFFYVFVSLKWHFESFNTDYRLLQSIDPRRMKGWISTKLVLGSWKTIKNIFSHVKYSCLLCNLFFLPNAKIIYSARYWLKTLQFGQSAQFASRLDIYEWGQNSGEPHFGAGDAEGPKTQNLFLFELINRKSHVV